MNIIYVALNKKTGKIMSGAKGQYAFGDTNTLARSIGQAYGYSAMKEGVKPKDMYTVHEFNIDMMTPANTEPFTIKEVESTNWNDESHLQIYVNGRSVVSCGSFSECPEDASIDRDLDFVRNITSLMEQAYEAGKAGRPLEVTYEEEAEEE